MINANQSKETVRVLEIGSADGAVVSPYLFGHNLEHTRSCVAAGLSAQMLRNRKFAGRPGFGVPEHAGVASEWFGIGARAFFCNDRDPYVRHRRDNGMWRRNETNAQTVINPAEGAEAGIGQQGLYLREGLAYRFRAAVKCSGGLDVLAALTDRSGDTVYASAVLHCAGGDWETPETELIPSAADAEGCLRLTFRSRGKVVFGAVSLLPPDTFRGMRGDTVACLAELGVGMLRWPGGNFSGEYRWQDMFLPVDMRAPLQAFTEDETQPYTHGYDMHEIDTDDFVALCRKIGAEPFITVNLAWDSAEECAAWVEYCNGGPDTPYGRLRAERGHPEPYRVKYWSLGNEMGYGHMEGPMQPEQYAALARAAAEKMRAVSPYLVLCSSGPYTPGKAAAEWIAGSARRLLPLASLISFHTYNNIPYDCSSEQALRESWEQSLRAPLENLAQLRALRAITPAEIGIAYDEWNMWAAWFRRSCTVEGLYAARMLHVMLANAPLLGTPILCYFQPVSEGAVAVFRDRAELSAAGQAFALLKAHMGGHLYRVEGAENCDVLATARNGVLTVSLLNTEFELSAVYLLNTPGTVLEARLLEADDLLPGSRFSEHGLPDPQKKGGIRLELPPRSAALVRIRLPSSNF